MSHAPLGASLSTEDDNNNDDNGKQKTWGAGVELSSILIVCALAFFNVVWCIFLLLEVVEVYPTSSLFEPISSR